MVTIGWPPRDLGQMPMSHQREGVERPNGIDSSPLAGTGPRWPQFVEAPRPGFGGVTLDEYLDRFDLKTSAAGRRLAERAALAVPPTPDASRTQLIERIDRGRCPGLATEQLPT